MRLTKLFCVLECGGPFLFLMNLGFLISWVQPGHPYFLFRLFIKYFRNLVAGFLETRFFFWFELERVIVILGLFL